MPPKTQVDSTVVETPKKKPVMLITAFFLCFIFSVLASSGVAYIMLKPSPENAKAADTITEQGNLIATMERTLAQQSSKIKTIEEQSEVLKLYLRHSSSTALKNILIDQERNIQAYLKVMKSAMKDLSALSPRTTDWNNEYQYQLDLALKGSIEREDLLKILKTGEPNEKSQ
ncbi:MAG: hypothetical protein ACTH58_13980 [Marinomonas foliarum]|jgi:hypothetical protein|uniref:Uncharacterized protein n=1 Tax=Marinomonas foliarum TaxID=491950 RepID=A0ABX7IR73_9GAMM|nr:hypothetical protein [Marinomonas foliarum]QRV24760.1 hypothetical protein JSY38_04270 [Marinomonas foliarum]